MSKRCSVGWNHYKQSRIAIVTKKHKCAVDTFHEYGRQYININYHQSQFDTRFILYIQKNGRLLVLVKLHPGSFQEARVYVSIVSRLFPYDVEQAVIDFRKKKSFSLQVSLRD